MNAEDLYIIQNSFTLFALFPLQCSNRSKNLYFSSSSPIRLVFNSSTQVDCPFIVCMTYAFHTPDKLCFILDLMNGGDLHYHLSQHGVFNESEMKFYAAEVSSHVYAAHLSFHPIIEYRKTIECISVNGFCFAYQLKT